MNQAAVSIRSLSGYPSYLVIVHDGFRVPCNSLSEAEAVKARFDARYPEQPSTIRVN